MKKSSFENAFELPALLLSYTVCVRFQLDYLLLCQDKKVNLMPPEILRQDIPEWQEGQDLVTWCTVYPQAQCHWLLGCDIERYLFLHTRSTIHCTKDQEPQLCHSIQLDTKKRNFHKSHHYVIYKGCGMMLVADCVLEVAKPGISLNIW